jgi:hypothetical protein
MTDLLIRDPNDTGDIPAVGEKTVRIVGEGTQNLAPYVHGLPPALRRPTASLPIYLPAAGCRRIVPNDEDFETGPTQPAPQPVPAPGPPPTPVVDDRPRSGGEEVVWGYADPADKYLGRHRRPSRWDWLTVPLSAAVQIIRAAL